VHPSSFSYRKKMLKEMRELKEMILGLMGRAEE